MVERNKHRPGQIDADAFRALPERAQEMWFFYCERSVIRQKIENLMFIQIMGLDYSYCKSPIEVMFKFAYDLILYDDNYPDLILEPQYEIETNNKRYIADFVFFADESTASEIKNENYKLVIECDGHEFHEKTKEQVAYDNEREYDIKTAGFDILRFSGSQIYNHPFRCAAQTYEYILKKVGE